MQYTTYDGSPLGPILLAADEIGLTGLWLEGQKHFAAHRKEGDTQTEDDGHGNRELPVFQAAKRWLDIYFSGQEPEVEVPIHLIGTDFQKEVWKILCEIPYGQTITYGQIARQIAERRDKKTMSAQAVGGAVGRNPISVIVPCHRVVGSDGSMTGYAGGIDKKMFLLELEGTLKDFA